MYSISQVTSDYNYLYNQTVLSTPSEALYQLTPLEFPLSGKEIAGIVILGIMNMMASAGGVAAGGIMIPFVMIFMGLEIQECLPLAHSFSVISALSGFIINYNLRHPFRTWRKIIDYEVIIMTMPMVILGTMIGVEIGTYMTQFQLVILLEIVLLYTLYKTIQKAIHFWLKENRKRKESLMPLIERQKRSKSKTKSRIATSFSRMSEKLPSKQILAIVDEESSHFTIDRSVRIFLTIILVIATLILMETNFTTAENLNKIIQELVFFAFIMYCLVATLVNAKHVNNIHEVKKREYYDFDEHDIQFNQKKKIVYLIAMCFVAGLLSGVLGIASGIIMNPLLLSLGMLPSVTAATNQYVGMIASFSVALEFMYKGKMNYDYMILLGSVILIGAVVGQTQVNKLVKWTGRQSVIVIIFAIVIFSSFVVLPFKYAID